MQLTLQGLAERKSWEQKGYRLPSYPINDMREKTKEAPFWIHFGAGNLFRAFHANIAERLLNEKVLDRGIVAAEGFDYEIIEKMYAPRDNLEIDVTLKADGKIEKNVIASVAEARPLDSQNEQAYERLKDIFTSDSLQMATFTITEKGYNLVDRTGQPFPDVQADFEAGPAKPSSYMGKVASLLYARYQAGQKPIAMVSTDNCSHNGDKLCNAISMFADTWVENHKAEPGFKEYVDSHKVSFPWSMIDKITPRPDDSVETILREDGVEELDTVVTSKHTFVAPFVNAEETEYLVIEDDFPNGRPDMTKGGIIFTDRETVEKVEKMKVSTCLNPLHTCLAIYGCLLGYEKISEEMKDPQLKKMVEVVGYQEGLPVVTDPGILNPKEFLDTVLKVRIPNPFMPDTPQRIATDTSQKLAVRFGNTIKAYAASEQLKVSDLKIIPLVLAGWIRYLIGIDDQGEKFELSPDPMLEELCPHVAGISLGDRVGSERLKPILSNKRIFGVDLYEMGMADLICSYFQELVAKKGAVRETLEKYLM